ncbi:MAG: endoribonuclease MazF [Candidatus Obscuribacterales bacterium]|nr:endoribonuclease MazF [Candidatus Obscuribacterales bacterium]
MVKPAKKYVPERGDIVWLQFEPQSGKEQKGHRPAFIISPSQYNGLVGLALVCPITSKIKDYPFEVRLTLDSNKKISGVILADQVKSLDWQIRKAEFISKAPKNVTEEVIAKLSTLLQSKS